MSKKMDLLRTIQGRVSRTVPAMMGALGLISIIEELIRFPNFAEYILSAWSSLTNFLWGDLLNGIISIVLPDFEILIPQIWRDYLTVAIIVFLADLRSASAAVSQIRKEFNVPDFSPVSTLRYDISNLNIGGILVRIFEASIWPMLLLSSIFEVLVTRSFVESVLEKSLSVEDLDYYVIIRAQRLRASVFFETFYFAFLMVVISQIFLIVGVGV